MTRSTSLLIALAMAAAACGTAAPDAESPATAPPRTEATPASTNAEQPTTDATQVPSETTAPTEGDAPAGPALVAEGPPAPNFSLSLDDGSTFELASAERPVMLVFWAEW